MLAPNLQLGAILILLATDSENQIKDPLENPQCGKFNANFILLAIRQLTYEILNY